MSELLTTKTIEQLKQEMGPVKASQILRHTKYEQCKNILSEGNKRCAVGVIASYLGWDGKMNLDGNWTVDKDGNYTTKPVYDKVDEFIGLRFPLSVMNDNGYTFEEIADRLEEKGL